MKPFVFATFVAGATMSIALPTYADSANWSKEKADQVDRNRNSNSGIGNGGERQERWVGPWIPTMHGEDGPMDQDPGNSADHNMACETPEGETFILTEC